MAEIQDWERETLRDELAVMLRRNDITKARLTYATIVAEWRSVRIADEIYAAARVEAAKMAESETLIPTSWYCPVCCQTHNAATWQCLRGVWAPDIAPWTCPKCTHTNPAETAQCVRCRKLRPQRVPNDLTPIGSP